MCGGVLEGSRDRPHSVAVSHLTVLALDLLSLPGAKCARGPLLVVGFTSHGVNCGFPEPGESRILAPGTQERDCAMRDAVNLGKTGSLFIL